MGYSCTDFVDSVIEQLGLGDAIPEGFRDAPDAQAEICCAEIERLQRFAGSIILAVQMLQKAEESLGTVSDLVVGAFVEAVTTVAENFAADSESPAMLDKLIDMYTAKLPDSGVPQ